MAIYIGQCGEEITYNSEDPKALSFLQFYIKAEKDFEESKNKYIADLRLIGIKAAHYEDGHIDRGKDQYKDYLELAYPLFNDGIEVCNRRL